MGIKKRVLNKIIKRYDAGDAKVSDLLQIIEKHLMLSPKNAQLHKMQKILKLNTSKAVYRKAKGKEMWNIMYTMY